MLELFLAEFKRSWIEFIRYPAEAIGELSPLRSFMGYFSVPLHSRTCIAVWRPTRCDCCRVCALDLVLSIMDDIAFGLQYEAQVGTRAGFPLDFGALKVFSAGDRQPDITLDP